MPPHSRALVLASADWAALLAALARTPAGAAVATAPQALACAVLAAPVAVARWIAERSPELAMQPALRVLVVGAERLDAVDQGRWYQLLPVLLGTAMSVCITLVGEQLDTERMSPLQAQAPRTPARRHRGSLASYFTVAAAAEHDLAIVFHPGFQKHRGWLRDTSVAALVASRVPLIVSSYEQDEYEMDRWIVECHGFSVRPDPLLNPFDLDFSAAGTSIRWGRALWQFGDRVPISGADVDTARLDRLGVLSRMVMHSIVLRREPAAAYGARVTLTASDGASRSLTYLFDDYFVDAADARVLALRGGQLEPVASLPAEVLATYPASGATDLERAVWAACVKAEHLMHFYPALPDDRSPDLVARSMHAELTQKIDALLKLP